MRYLQATGVLETKLTYIISLVAVKILAPCFSKTWVPIQFKISLFSLSWLAIEIAAVKNFINHQYIFRAKPWTIRNAPVTVPNMVRPAAMVVTSILSHAAKNFWKKVKPGAEVLSRRRKKVRERRKRLQIGEEDIVRLCYFSGEIWAQLETRRGMWLRRGPSQLYKFTAFRSA